MPSIVCKGTQPLQTNCLWRTWYLRLQHKPHDAFVITHRNATVASQTRNVWSVNTRHEIRKYLEFLLIWQQLTRTSDVMLRRTYCQWYKKKMGSSEFVLRRFYWVTYDRHFLHKIHKRVFLWSYQDCSSNLHLISSLSYLCFNGWLLSYALYLGWIPNI